MDIVCSYTTAIKRLAEKLNPKNYAVMKWHTQARSINTDIKIKIDLTLPGISATKIVMWNFHVVEYDKGRYNMTLGRYL